MSRARSEALLALLLVAGAGACVPETPVVLYPAEGDGARDVANIAFRTPITVQEKFVLRPDERAGACPDPARGLVYAQSRDGTLLALDDELGRVVWEVELSGALGGVPVLADADSLVLGTDDGELIRFDLETREVRWRYETKGVIRQAPLIRDGVVYAANSRDELLAVELEDGAFRWQYARDFQKDFTVYGRAGVAYRPLDEGEDMDSGVVYSGFADGRVAAIGAGSGKALWVTNLAPPGGGRFADADGTPVVDEASGELVVTAQASGVHGLNLSDGVVQWTTPIRGAGSPIRGPGNAYIVASSLEGLFAVERGGRVRWHSELDPGAISTPLIVGGSVFVTHAEEGLLGYDVRGGAQIMQLRTGSGMSSTPVHDPVLDRLYVTSNRGELIALTLNEA